MPSSLIHLSFYRFHDLGEEPTLRAHQAELKALCREHGLKGTILLAREGLNGMLVGTRAAVDAIRAWVTQRTLAVANDFKEAEAPPHAFQRMLVKLKKEIIPVGDPELRPSERTAPRLSAQQLKEWLDSGRPLMLLDTRNEYEVSVGTFENAQTFGLDHSRQFAGRAAENLEALKRQPVVTFCTGGIRCEKASAYLLKLGLTDVYQLDGGILRYFETVGGAHYQGNCFVFDEREAVDPELRPVPRSADPTRSFGRHRR